MCLFRTNPDRISIATNITSTFYIVYVHMPNSILSLVLNCPVLAMSSQQLSHVIPAIVTCHPAIVTCHPAIVTCHPSNCHMSNCHMSSQQLSHVIPAIVTCHPAIVTCPIVTCHPSNCHMSSQQLSHVQLSHVIPAIVTVSHNPLVQFLCPMLNMSWFQRKKDYHQPCRPQQLGSFISMWTIDSIACSSQLV